MSQINLDEKSLELVAVEIDEEDLNTNFACCWGTFACFTTYGCSSFTTGSTAACGC